MEVLPPYSLSRGAPSAARPPLHNCLTLPWRRVRDSNPRTGCPVCGFQDRRLQPLGQPSGQPATSLKLAAAPCQPVRTYQHSFVSVAQDRPYGQRRQVYAGVLRAVNANKSLERGHGTLTHCYVAPASVVGATRDRQSCLVVVEVTSPSPARRHPDRFLLCLLRYLGALRGTSCHLRPGRQSRQQPCLLRSSRGANRCR